MSQVRRPPRRVRAPPPLRRPPLQQTGGGAAQSRHAHTDAGCKDRKKKQGGNTGARQEGTPFQPVTARPAAPTVLELATCPPLLREIHVNAKAVATAA